MVFRNRQHAGRLLAQKLKSRHIKPDIVFGLARGGVVVAAEIAAAFKVPLDVLVVRKISPPGNPEFAIGAIAAGTAVWWDENVVHRLGLSPQWQKQQINDKKIEISEYLANISIPKKTTLSRMKFRNIVLADDGAATGATMMAAIGAVRDGFQVVALPVASTDAAAKIQSQADKTVILDIDPDFRAVGQYYREFSQVSWEEVRQLLIQFKL